MAKKIRGRNEGSIWRQGNRWRAAVSIGCRRLTTSFTTRAECKVWIREQLNQIDQGYIHTDAKLTLEQYLADWLVIHRTRVKPKSAQRYQQILRDYIIPHLGKSLLPDLRASHIEGLYQKLLQEGVSPRNVRYVHALLHRSLSDAVKRGLVGLNAAHGARQPKYVHKEMQILDEGQVMQFLLTVQEDRNAALYHIAFKTGMRQGELLGLKWSDLDWNKGTIKVLRQVQRVKGEGMVFVSPKTKAGRRTISLGTETLRMLQEHWQKQQLERAAAGDRWREFNLIFPSTIGTPQSTSNLLKSFKALLEKAKVLNIRFHDMRHTAASLMLNRGVSDFVVSKILGHSKPSTTLDIYGHLIPVMHEGVGNLMDDLLTPIPVVMGKSAISDIPLEYMQR